MGSGNGNHSKCAGDRGAWLVGLDALTVPLESPAALSTLLSALAGLASGRYQQEISGWTESEVRGWLLLAPCLHGYLGLPVTARQITLPLWGLYPSLCL